MAEYLRKECGDLNEAASDNGDNKDDDDDDDDANSKDIKVVEIGTGEALTICHHERQIKEDKSAEEKSKPYISMIILC